MRLARCLVRVKTIAGLQSVLRRARARAASASGSRRPRRASARSSRPGAGVRQLDDLRDRAAARSARLADLLRHRRREEQVLPLARQRAEDAPDVGQEAHVEHVVGLVEDEHVDVRRSRARGCWIRSSRRPGQAIDDLGSAPQGVDLALRRDAAEDDRGLDPRVRASRRNSTSIWTASSRVGARIRRAGGPCRRSSIRRCRIGSAKAAVLPVPVWARPSTSRPSRTAGMVSAWIGRGESKPASAMARRRVESSSKREKPLAIGAVGCAMALDK